jgi:phosphatidylinositol alpha-1,6-mannosyltransferase
MVLSIEFPPGPGGLGTLAYQAALHLSEMGWEVQVLTPQDYVDRSARIRFNAEQPFDVRYISHVEPPLLEGFRRLLVAIWSMQRKQPDVLFAVGKQAVWLAAALSRSTGVPLVVVCTGSEFTGRSRLDRRLNKWAFGRAHHRLVISRYTQQLMAETGVGGATTLVPCGADALRFRPGVATEKLRAKLEIGEGPVLLTVGQLSQRKAQDVVIRALPAVLAEHPELIYVMVGLPTQVRELENLAQELGVRAHVRFVGAVPTDELPLCYNLADLFVLVSRRTEDGNVEGYGIVVAEAALCGVPAVVSRGCGLEEAVLEDQTALLVDADDPDATAVAILRLLADERLRKKMGAMARRHVLKAGTWAQRVALYDRALRSVVGGQ